MEDIKKRDRAGVNPNKTTNTSIIKNKTTSPLDGNNNGKAAISQQSARDPPQSDIYNSPK